MATVEASNLLSALLVRILLLVEYVSRSFLQPEIAGTHETEYMFGAVFIWRHVSRPLPSPHDSRSRMPHIEKQQCICNSGVTPVWLMTMQSLRASQLNQQRDRVQTLTSALAPQDPPCMWPPVCV